jgi:hypothetical protein
MLKNFTLFLPLIISADYAQTIVIRFYRVWLGCMRRFRFNEWDGLVGTLAGDDTIFALEN